MADMVTEIKKLMKDKKLIVGSDETLKGLRTGKLAKIYLADNCPASMREDIARYAGIDGVEIVETRMQNTELGDICKKPFAISVMGLQK